MKWMMKQKVKDKRKILVAEISGKRAGDKKDRPTEKYDIDFDHVIISNNSEGYITDWDIVNVPNDYMEWYKEKVKMSDNAWYAPMNRSYAIKYARENGYDYLIQLDDNITNLELAYLLKDKGLNRRYRAVNKDGMMNDFIDMIVCVLENTNASMVGCALSGTSVPDDEFLAERYVYSLFGLNVHNCPDIFHGDFEDDIEYRLKCAELKAPAIQISPLRYGKTGQRGHKDETGNRAAYTQAGLKRGEHMRILHGDIYSCGYSDKTATVNEKARDGGKYFKHKIKPFKVGILIKDREILNKKMKELFKKYSTEHEDKAVFKEKKKRI